MRKSTHSLYFLALALMAISCDTTSSPEEKSLSEVATDTTKIPIDPSLLAIPIEPTLSGTFRYRFERRESFADARTTEFGDILYARSVDGSAIVTARLTKDSVILVHPGEDSIHSDTTFQISGLSSLVGGGYRCDDASIHCLDTIVTIQSAARNATIARMHGPVGKGHQLALPGIGLIEAATETSSIRFLHSTSTRIELVSIDGLPL